MAKMILSLVLLLLNVSLSQSMVSTGRTGYGLVGYGINMYDPNCAYACRAIISSSALNCSTYSAIDGMGSMAASEMSSMNETAAEADETASTSAACYATDDTFLKTLAYCISTRCDGTIEAWVLEQWWLNNVAGRAPNPPTNKYTYQQALALVTAVPKVTLVDGDPLNQTSLVGDDDYESNFNAQEVFEEQEILHEKYGYDYSRISQDHSITILKLVSSSSSLDLLPQSHFHFFASYPFEDSLLPNSIPWLSHLLFGASNTVKVSDTVSSKSLLVAKAYSLST